MSTTLTKSAMALLVALVSATQSTGHGYVVPKAPATKQLVEAGFIEVNEEIKQDDEVGARATEAGISFAAGSTDVSGTDTTANTGLTDTASTDLGGSVAAGNSQGTSSAPVAKKTFAIEKAVPLVEKTRAPVAEQYPFAELEIGDSFFVANDDVKSGNAYKTLNSTVNTANARFSTDTGATRPHRRNPNLQVAIRKQDRKFELRHFTQEDGTKGARVYRVEVVAE